MYRRALLASLATSLAGCSLAPSEPPPASYPRTRPNIFISFDWDPDRSALSVSFEGGNRLTAENTDRLTIVTPDLDDSETIWVGPAETNAKASFPLTPETAVTHELPRPASTNVYWFEPGEGDEELVARWDPEIESTEVDG
ncbi:hypothetical protein [Halorubrum tropicale]|uniref:hypothetical protein n=1 Tax=Halorubrum tropicale TaxID=1765655 RepID=UPI0011122558|nr:hypothetical protein [Halorubrum tropicale]